jgi:CHAD domain-containing protein
MATVSTLAGARPSKDGRRALSYSMERVLEELEKLRESHPQDDSPEHEEIVHDLRVSIRRCRSVAAVMEEVDPDPAWRDMRRAAKKLFHGLGALRDMQVMKAWIQKLAPEGDAVAAQLLEVHVAGEGELRGKAQRAARKFDTKNWRNLERTLRRRARFVPHGSPVAECLALERLENAKEWHARALRTEKTKPWHTLRKAMKVFRYTVENMLPEHHVRWREDLKRVQDLLGDVHDLDVLAAEVESATIAPDAEESRSKWLDTLASERAERIATYRQLMTGTTSLWNGWRYGLPNGERLQAAAMARLRATARAADARPRRTARTARIAKALFHSLRRARAGRIFDDARARQVLIASARLMNVRHYAESESPSAKTKSPQKDAHKFLRSLAVPPGFTTADWALLLAAVRYHRGAEPREKSAAFARLSVEQQPALRALAGTLRLAHALRKCGVDSAGQFRAENGPDAVVLRVPGLPDSVDTAARLAAAKHLLEMYLGKPLVLRRAPEVAVAPHTTEAPVLSAAAVESVHLANASD